KRLDHCLLRRYWLHRLTIARSPTKIAADVARPTHCAIPNIRNALLPILRRIGGIRFARARTVLPTLRSGDTRWSIPDMLPTVTCQQTAILGRRRRICVVRVVITQLYWWWRGGRPRLSRVHDAYSRGWIQRSAGCKPARIGEGERVVIDI